MIMKIVREGLKSLLKKEMGIEVAVEAEMGRETVQLVRELQPDVVIRDISMPDPNGSRQPGKSLPTHRMLNNCPVDAFRQRVY